MRKIVTCILSAVVSLLGCGKKQTPAPPTKASIADLKFPVVWVFGDTSVLPVKDAAGLETLHSNYVNLNREEPRHLIDASLQIYKVENLRSTRTGLGQMLNPVGSTPIAFELLPTERGIDAVRRMIAAVRYLGAEPDTVRAAVNRQTTLDGIIQSLNDGSEGVVHDKRDGTEE